MRRIIVFLLIMVFLISGCSFNVEVVTPAPSAVDPISETQPVELPTATVPAILATAAVGFTPTGSDPVFYGAYAALDATEAPGQSSFPVGTKQIFVIWNYRNMREGLTVKREWYLDGQLWLMREEPWDFATYGVTGTMRDISIYDVDIGLPSGAYQLKVYIDNVQQPIGNGPATLNYINFVIQPNEAYKSITSPDFQWTAEIYGEKRIVIRDVNGTPKDLYTGGEIPYLTWFANSKNLLFVDRDRSGQISGSPFGARDDLWIADIQSGEKHLLYQSDTVFNGHTGPTLSTYEKYIVSLEGSGYGDACVVDSRLIFFELASDRQSVTAIKQEQFAGLPTSNDGSVYPLEGGGWEADNLFRVTLNGTCAVDQSQFGPYVFNLSALTATKSSSASSPLIPGDLGWGRLHGKVVDVVTGQPIVGATVTCQHSSYISPATCSETATTNVQGTYIFEAAFFHDTDTIKLTVQAEGYQPQEMTRSASEFLVTDIEMDFSLNKVQ